MAKIVVLDKKGVSIPAGDLAYVVPPTVDFFVEVDIDSKIAKELEVDKILMKKFKDQAKEILEFTTREVEKKCKIFDNYFREIIDNGKDAKKAKSEVEKHLKGLNEALKQDYAVAVKAAELGVEKVWQEIQAAKQEWKKHKIKIVLRIVGTAAVLAVSIAALAVSGWTGGVSGAAAIMGFVKAGVTIAKTIRECAISIDTAIKDLERELDWVEAAAENSFKNVTNDTIATVFREFVGVSQPHLGVVQDSYKTVKAKYAHMVVQTHDLSKKAGTARKGRDDAEKGFLDEAEKKLQKHPTKNKPEQLKKIQMNFKKQMAKYDKGIEDAENAALALYEETKRLAPTVAELGKRVKELELKDPAGLKYFREVIKLSTLALAPFDGNNIAKKAFDLGTGIGGSLGGYAWDKVSNGALEGTVFG